MRGAGILLSCVKLYAPALVLVVLAGIAAAGAASVIVSVLGILVLACASAASVHEQRLHPLGHRTHAKSRRQRHG